MARKRFTAEQIISKLRGRGRTVEGQDDRAGGKKLGITEQTTTAGGRSTVVCAQTKRSG